MQIEDGKNNRKYTLYLVALVLLSLYLSLGETIIPKPFPWMKIGLANLATLIALKKFGKKMAIEVVVLRVIIQGLMLGTVFAPGFIISFFSGLVSVLVMTALYSYKNKINIITISMIAGFLHNLTQLIVVYLLMFRSVELGSRGILLFVCSFLLIGAISGAIIGIIGDRIKIREVRI